MNRFTRALCLVLAAVFAAPVWAGLLTQVTQVNDNLGPYTDYYFGSTGVVISGDGLWFVAASPYIVFNPDDYDGTGTAEIFNYTGGEWPNTGGWTDGPTTAANYGTGIGISANGATVIFGFGASCAQDPMSMNPTICDTPAEVDLQPSFPTGQPGQLGCSFNDPTDTPNFESNFGQAVALSGDGHTAIVGAPQAGPNMPVNGPPVNPGEAFIYTYNGSACNGSTTWLRQTIQNPAGSTGVEFGMSVAMSANGETALVGENGSTAYLYELVNGTWTLTQTFTDGLSLVPNVTGGMALSADGKTAVFSGVNGVVVETQGATPATWNEYTIPIDNAYGPVAISADGTTIAAGNGKSGADASVNLYTLTGGTWAQTQTISAPSGASGFGMSGVALSADKETLVVSAPYTTVTASGYAYTDAGVVYVYQSPADLNLAMTASANQVALNQQVTLNATVTNNDTAVTAYNVSYTYTIPTGLSFVSSQPGDNGTCTLSGQTVTCVLSSLAPTAKWQPAITIQVGTAGAYTNTASVTSNQPDPNTANNSATVSIGMLPPTVSNGMVTTNVGVAVNGTLAGNNPCSCGTLAFSIVSQPVHGTVTLTNAATGAFTYTPASGYAGADSFTFKLSNGFTSSAAATESVTVASAGPVASNGSVSAHSDRPVRGVLKATGSGRLTFTITSEPAHGTVLLLNPRRGRFLYIPDFRYSGTDSFTFTASDSAGVSNTATESITIVAAPPIAVPGVVAATEGMPASGTLRAFGSGPFTFVVVNQPAHGTVVVTNAATGAFTYSPQSGFSGFDQFTFDASNSGGTSRAAPEFVLVRRARPIRGPRR